MAGTGETLLEPPQESQENPLDLQLRVAAGYGGQYSCPPLPSWVALHRAVGLSVLVEGVET